MELIAELELEKEPGMVLSLARNRSRSRSRARRAFEVLGTGGGDSKDRKLGLALANAVPNAVMSESILGRAGLERSTTRSRCECPDDRRAATVENVPGLLRSR